MIILHHCDDLGGAGISLLNIFNMLKEKYDCKVYVPHQDSKIAKYLKKYDVTLNAINDDVGMISSYSGGPKVFSRTFAKNFLEIKETKNSLQHIIDQEKPDIVAVNSMTLAWAGKLIQKNGAKSICFVRETYINNLGMGYIKFCLDRWFNAVIFISEFDKKVFKCKAKVQDVVHNCLQPKDYRTDLNREEACRYLNIENNFFNVLFVGGMDELKGWYIIESAMKKLEEYDIRLIVAGNIENKEARDKKNVTFIGLRTDMPHVYKACDVLVFPSTAPHQARPVFEAGILGLPVIISDFEETREFVRDGENGLTFKPNNSEDLALKIEKLYKNKNLREMLGKANRENALKHHEFSKCQEKLLKIIEGLQC